MNYQEQCNMSAEQQGITAISNALANAGIESTIEQTGGFCMVAYVDGTNGLRLGVTSEALALIDEDEEETELEEYATSEDGTLSAETLAHIVRTVEEYLYLINNPLFTCTTYWVDDMNVACKKCYLEQCQEFELFEIIGTTGEEYEPENEGGGLVCEYCGRFCTEYKNTNAVETTYSTNFTMTAEVMN